MSIRLGDAAPDFTAVTTDGLLSFHEWKAGSWAVLFSHPADFTPVCTTELGRTAALSGEFAARNAKPIAVSVDSVDDHHAWVPDIAEVAGVPVDFPIIADEDRAVAQAYDMIHPGEGDTSTVRSPISTPAEWTPGERVIVAPTISTDDARERFENVDEVRPYLRFADAPA